MLLLFALLVPTQEVLQDASALFRRKDAGDIKACGLKLLRRLEVRLRDVSTKS